MAGMPRTRVTFPRILIRMRQFIRNDHLILAVLALFVGGGVGGAAVLFREAILLVQQGFFGTDSERLEQFVGALPWWQVLLAPTAAGLIVGLIIWRFLPGGKPHAIAEVIEASAMRGAWMSSRVGVVAALVSAISIGGGASVGREGPAVHLGASLAAWIGRRLHLNRSLARTLLGCGVGAAVGASFNAPIAGALFANEVVVGHYALKAFAPVVIASVAGTAVSRAYFGYFPAFEIGDRILASFWEFPAFVGLGIVSGISAIVFMRSIFLAQDASAKIPVPPWLKPAIGGLAVGAIALLFPQVLGVGYGVTESAILVEFSLQMLIAVGIAKVVATAISHGFGFAGGVFSPALVLGAMVGGAYGIIATHVFPDYSSGPAAYTIVGMGAVAAAVLGAPISTTLIIFELTGDYALSLAVMVAIVVSSEITHHFFGPSYFAEQLKRRGIDLKGGFETQIMASIKVRTVLDAHALDAETVDIGANVQEVRQKLTQSKTGELFVLRDGGALCGTITLSDMSAVAFDPDVDDLINANDLARLHPPVLAEDDDLEAAIRIMRDTGEYHIAVVRDRVSMIFTGCVHHRDVMGAYNRALVETHHEEHGF